MSKEFKWNYFIIGDNDFHDTIDYQIKISETAAITEGSIGVQT